MSSYKSKVPYFRFSDTLEEQIEELKSNPLLQRMNRAREEYTDPHRPIYHYVNPEGGLNDPNGLCYWKDNWHMFYQGYPPEDTRQHWGHAVSKDLIHWKDLPYCIYPDPEECCFSGATLVEEDRVLAMYHGTRAGNMLAVSSDPLLLNWNKIANAPVIPIPEDEQPYNVFDPCIWRKGDTYYALSAGQESTGPRNNRVAADFLFRSEDLEHWEFVHSFIEGDRFTRVGDDGACPYFWPLGDRHILLFFSHSSGGQYLLGDYDTERDKFVVTYGEKFNFGPAGPCGVHAPSAAPNPDGSVMVIFNMNPGKRTEGWNQIMTLPRRLTLGEDGNSVDIQPVGSVESLRRSPIEFSNKEISPNTEVVIEEASGRNYEMQLQIDDRGASVVEINVLRSPDKQEFTRIAVYRERGFFRRVPGRRTRNSFVTLDNSNSSIDPTTRARAPETLDVYIAPDEDISLRVFVDRSVVEVFVNNRRCVAERVYPAREDSLGISVKSIGSSALIKEFSFWELATIYE